ncbi:MAG: MotA/TolQ/ExbB proton channel family protein [Gammaproteobacteria bacterium]|nr:MotA/TolQ/ExbB proton channel family protein [Gammaproteobacteria bacterium]MYE99611.1 MotA/TolQ/ExbB proton channel family protein [Gammaproteobacteria bacterium]
MSETRIRIFAVIGGLLAGLLFVLIMSLLLRPAPNEITAGGVLLDRASPVYPFTIQNLMWLLFHIGLADVLVRFFQSGRELRQMKLQLLPEDRETMLRAKDLGQFYERARPVAAGDVCFLQRLIGRIILQFQSSRSVDQANSLLNSSLELLQHEIDLKYNMMRYVVWLIPTLGFIGTVVGIALALGEAGNMPDLEQSEALGGWMKSLTGSLALAFNTTLLALLLSAVLVFLMHLAQGREETALNRAGQYCLDNLINRLYEK